MWWISNLGEVHEFEPEEYLTHEEYAEANLKSSYGDLVSNGWVAVRERQHDIYIEGTVGGIERNKRTLSDLLMKIGEDRVEIFLDDIDRRLQTTAEKFIEDGIHRLLYEERLIHGRPIMPYNRQEVQVQQYKRRH